MTVLGIDVTTKRRVNGWEAVKPKPQNKPLYLLKAEEELEKAWNEYMDLVDYFYADLKPKDGAQVALEDAYDVIEACERKHKIAYQSYCQGLDDLIIPAFEEEL